MKLLKKITLVVVALLLLALSIVGKIDRNGTNTQYCLDQTITSIDRTHLKATPIYGPIKAGWAKVNITPPAATDLAGYGPRGHYKQVHDSLYTSVIVLDNQTHKVIIVNVDLLLFPPAVVEILKGKCKDNSIDFNTLFFTATHTHNGFGNWDNTIAGSFILGKYKEQQTIWLADQILLAIKIASQNTCEAKIAFNTINAQPYVTNRLVGAQGATDPWIRNIIIDRINGTRAVFTTFAAHATVIDMKQLVLARDYPGALVDSLECLKNIDFAVFAAGNVGSHRLNGFTNQIPFEQIAIAAKTLTALISKSLDSLDYNTTNTLSCHSIKLNLPESQLRLSKEIKVRDWLFKKLLSPLQADIVSCEIGDIILLGLPCDFSGEILTNHQLGKGLNFKNKHFISTSFNGNYIGYITEDAHYDAVVKEEVRGMNWVGPGMGNYFVTVIEHILEKY